jgi:hypothetical protein
MSESERDMSWRHWYNAATFVMATRHHLRNVPARLYRKPWLNRRTVEEGVTDMVAKFNKAELIKYK